MSKTRAPVPLTADELAPILRRLDVLIALLLRSQPKKERVTISDQIRMLGGFGLDNPAIGGIVGRGADFVNVVRKRGVPTNRAGGVKRARKARSTRSGSR